MLYKPQSKIEYENSIEKKFHEEQADKFFCSLEEKLKVFNQELVKGMYYLPSPVFMMDKGHLSYYGMRLTLPVYHDSDRKNRNEKAGFAVEYNYDPDFGYARIISGIYIEPYKGSDSLEGLEKILEGKDGLGSPAGKQVNEYFWHFARVFSLEGKSLNTEIAEVDDCISDLLDTVLQVAEAIRSNPQLKAQMDFIGK